MRNSKLVNGKYVYETVSSGPKVQKQFKEMTDINAIMAKYQKGEAITHLNRRVGVYGDFSEIRNYQSSLDLVLGAQKAFMALPSGVRKRFQNDPQQIIDFVSDKSNYDEAVKLGLIIPKSEASDAPAINAGVTTASTTGESKK